MPLLPEFLMRSLAAIQTTRCTWACAFLPPRGKLSFGSDCSLGFGGVHQAVRETIAALEVSLPDEFAQHRVDATVSWHSPSNCLNLTETAL